MRCSPCAPVPLSFLALCRPFPPHSAMEDALACTISPPPPAGYAMEDPDLEAELEELEQQGLEKELLETPNVPNAALVCSQQAHFPPCAMRQGLISSPAHSFLPLHFPVLSVVLPCKVFSFIPLSSHLPKVVPKVVLFPPVSPGPSIHQSMVSQAAISPADASFEPTPLLYAAVRPLQGSGAAHRGGRAGGASERDGAQRSLGQTDRRSACYGWGGTWRRSDGHRSESMCLACQLEQWSAWANAMAVLE